MASGLSPSTPSRTPASQKRVVDGLALQRDQPFLARLRGEIDDLLNHLHGIRGLREESLQPDFDRAHHLTEALVDERRPQRCRRPRSAGPAH